MNNTRSCIVIPDDKSCSLYTMLFGVSCAFFSLKHLLCDERDPTAITDKMLHGGASLVCLLLWRLEREERVNAEKRELLNKLMNAETEIQELKRLRVEDAKANAKVVSIFAAHEQRWLMERKKLTQKVQSLLNELRVANTEREEKASELHVRLQEKDKLLEEEKRKKREQEEHVKKTRKINEELIETLKREAQEHSKEIWKHKSAFIELVSAQQQLEAEMGRAVRQTEAEKQELDAVLEQKEQYVLMTQKLSMKLLKTRKDLEQKDNILSAMLRKSKLDIAKKHMLLNISKSRMVPELRKERYSLRSMLSRHHKFKPVAITGVKGVSSVAAMPSHTRSQPTNLHEYEQSDFNDEQDITNYLFSQQSISEAGEELDLAADVRQLEGWVQCEAEKYASVLEQRHQLEVDAFAEQLRIKDEKLEAFHWHSVSTDIELKRLHSHIEGLSQDLNKLKEQNLKVEALLLGRESELDALKEQMESHLQLGTPKSQKYPEVPSEEILEENTIRVTAVQSPDKEFDDKRDESLYLISGEECTREKDIVNAEKIPSTTWKMDLHALGVSYKIKRLKQQLLMFERLTGKQESCENRECDAKRNFYSLMSLINKQVSRYQSLQEKANDICRRMHKNNQDANSTGSVVAKTMGETRILGHLLEETFRLQHYIVATGQKLMEIESKIASGFVGVPDDEAATGFDMKKFADCLGTLFREIQRGMEVGISRIIGDLEGPLAWDGMIHPRT